MVDRLYILMRTDLDSMNAGKAIAQGSHASNAFTNLAKKLNRKNEIENWKHQSIGQGFGTVLVLDGGSMDNIDSIVSKAIEAGLIADIVHDKTYPLVDGEFVHHIPLDTCGFIFIKEEDVEGIGRNLVGDLKLHA